MQQLKPIGRAKEILMVMARGVCVCPCVRLEAGRGGGWEWLHLYKSLEPLYTMVH